MIAVLCVLQNFSKNVLTRSAVSGSSEAVGSSRNSISGSLITALPKDTLVF